jgi:hypothetical protein
MLIPPEGRLFVVRREPKPMLPLEQLWKAFEDGQVMQGDGLNVGMEIT